MHSQGLTKLTKTAQNEYSHKNNSGAWSSERSRTELRNMRAGQLIEIAKAMNIEIVGRRNNKPPRRREVLESILKDWPALKKGPKFRK